MIISKTPLRISLFGGGTDLKDYYGSEYGAVISTSIDKYIYVTINKRFEDSIRVSYSKTEIVDDVDKIQHPIVRNALKLVGIESGIEITSIADIPARTGLGSSSTFTIGLLNALYAYKGIYASPETLASQACKIEIELLKEPIGKQDQYAAAYGGFNYIQFNEDDSVFVEPLIYFKKFRDFINDNLMLFYTGITRNTSEILSDQKKNTVSKHEILTQMKYMTKEFKNLLLNDKDFNYIGKLLDKAWNLKKQMSNKISLECIDNYYNTAIQNGALGGKLLGAGGGGFLLLYCEPCNQGRVKNALYTLRSVPFKFESNGSKIIFAEN
jgi:D-glycero-alpha-D-manno-heptose-7-phosphate kinase